MNVILITVLLINALGCQAFINQTILIYRTHRENAPENGKTGTSTNRDSANNKQSITSDDLKLSEEHYTYRLNNIFLRDASLDLTHKKELVHCDTFIQETQKSLDCKSLESHKTGKNVPSKSYCDSFVRKISLQTVVKLSKFAFDIGANLTLIQQAQHVIDEWSNVIFTNARTSDDEFTKLKVRMGYFYELFLTNPVRGRNNIHCRGAILSSVNRTQTPLISTKQQKPKLIDELLYYVGQALTNGHMLGIKSLQCFEDGKESEFFITGNATIIQRSQFPYVISDFRFESRPDAENFKAVSNTHQERGQEGTPIVYTTESATVSKSDWLPFLNIRHHIKVFNEKPVVGKPNGRDKTMLIFDNIGVAQVETRWVGGIIFKTLQWYFESRPIKTEKDIEDYIEAAEESVKVTYWEEEKSKEFGTLLFKVKKDLGYSAIAKLGDLISGLIEEGQDYGNERVAYEVAI